MAPDSEIKKAFRVLSRKLHPGVRTPPPRVDAWDGCINEGSDGAER